MDAMSMLKSFRVVDLRELFIGKEKKGLKGDLIRRAIQLIQNECSQELLTKINDIYNSRCQPQAVTNPRASPQILSMKIADSTPSPSSQDSDVKLMSFPFHQTLDILVDLTALKPHFSFTLSEKQRKQLITQTTRFSGDEVQIRVRKPGEEPRRPCPPINITSQLKLSQPGDIQSGFITWRDRGKVKCYSFAVHLVRILSAKELLAQLRKSSVESVECCRARVCEKLCTGQDSDVATTGLRVSLLCPLGKTRLRVPCRGSGCAHLQCFDALTYVELNNMKPTWMCPVCDRPAPFTLLTIDGLLSSILVTAEESVVEIEFVADGSWRSVKDQHGNARRSPQTELSVTSLHSLAASEIIDLTLD
ncbi:E3 SUMO-protein ligase PIAS4b isoform X3 [Clupea harengus]|uniref:E3 SUMO-protein ligase PIAS4b isoform X3 n=1 Tax=Clupea harengus TaxID=7950 RepID=A0A6P8EXC5_CLUHA|nr:E3 SUMO-protein ligase PIAS4b isoform X3 [Clupea harengus]